jgi:nucleoside 2-deoxyribosyltransferase
MKITVCCSLAFADEAIKIEEDLKKLGFDVEIPFTIHDCKSKGIEDIKQWVEDLIEKDPDEFDKLKKERMELHYSKVEKADAILVLNYDKKGIKNYIGANTLLEMGLAFWLKKPIYLLNSIPEELDYAEEIKGMMPIVINQDLSLIKL